MAKKTGRKARKPEGAAAELAEVKPIEVEPALYTYDARRYLSDVKIPGYGSAVFALFGVALLIIRPEMGEMTALLNVVALILIIAGVYTFERTFVAHAYPETVRLDERGIEFASFGRTDRFEAEELVSCSVREAQMHRAFVRIKDEHGKSGRYFLSCSDMKTGDGRDGDAIQRYLFAHEERLDPQNIRVRARKLNEKKDEA